jgi:hypothetical protein
MGIEVALQTTHVAVAFISQFTVALVACLDVTGQLESQLAQFTWLIDGLRDRDEGCHLRLPFNNRNALMKINV